MSLRNGSHAPGPEPESKNPQPSPEFVEMLRAMFKPVPVRKCSCGRTVYQMKPSLYPYGEYRIEDLRKGKCFHGKDYVELGSDCPVIGGEFLGHIVVLGCVCDAVARAEKKFREAKAAAPAPESPVPQEAAAL